jgi:aminoglycoside phosphotransferase (APT) family kinase protein
VQPYALCEDVDVLGSAFYVMEFVEGRIFTNPSMPGVGPEDQRALIRAAIATVERLHSLNPAEVGLGTFGRPEG